MRFRELMLAEKTVLFSALDTEQLREELKKVVIHQETAIDGLCDELALYSTGTQDPRKPASYFLIGPTGVGKNYLVESTLKLFEELWGIEVPYLELEGPEFTYPSDINELKGAARGFIRSDEEGIMTQFYKRAHDKPFSVILIDEVELTDRDEAWLCEVAAEVSDAIEAGAFFPNPSWMCGGCEYRSRCGAA